MRTSSCVEEEFICCAQSSPWPWPWSGADQSNNNKYLTLQQMHFMDSWFVHKCFQKWNLIWQSFSFWIVQIVIFGHSQKDWLRKWAIERKVLESLLKSLLLFSLTWVALGMEAAFRLVVSFRCELQKKQWWKLSWNLGNFVKISYWLESGRFGIWRKQRKWKSTTLTG